MDAALLRQRCHCGCWRSVTIECSDPLAQISRKSVHLVPVRVLGVSPRRLIQIHGAHNGGHDCTMNGIHGGVAGRAAKGGRDMGMLLHGTIQEGLDQQTVSLIGGFGRHDAHGIESGQWSLMCELLAVISHKLHEFGSILKRVDRSAQDHGRSTPIMAQDWFLLTLLDVPKLNADALRSGFGPQHLCDPLSNLFRLSMDRAVSDQYPINAVMVGLVFGSVQCKSRGGTKEGPCCLSEESPSLWVLQDERRTRSSRW